MLNHIIVTLKIGLIVSVVGKILNRILNKNLQVHSNKAVAKSGLDNSNELSQALRAISLIKASRITVIALAVIISACSTPSGLSEKKPLNIIEKNTPEQWQANKSQSSLASPVTDGWLKSFNDSALEKMVAYALENNYQLASARINVELAKARLNVSEATDFPALSLSLDNSRRKQVTNSTTSYQNSADISVDLSYELDLWGKLSDEQNQSRLNFAAAQADYQQSKQTLVANISKAWFDLTQAQQLLNLYQERADNLQRNLVMIQSSYQLGLNEALDVYLTKNTVNQELARVAEQQQTLQASSRTLELLLGDYPLAKKVSVQNLPIIDDEIKLGLPAQLLTRRADIQASWLALLALDAGLAVAHKQRFPSFNLNASVSDNATELTNLLNGGALAWSLLGSISTPLFNAGKLESLEQQAKLSVEQKEQQYLQQVYQAFADVENSISARDSLNQRYAYYLKAQENALAAEKLSFDQYLRGLVTYTTVLEAQRRSFDAQTTVIQLANLLLQNRIEIYRILGGDYLNNPSENASKSEKSLLPASLINRISMEK
jgi:NodT family efflux transporter outer membrane factor (OMF) lipoprotein